MSIFFAVIGMVIGRCLYHLIITPIQRKKAREECIRDGLVPHDMI